MAEREQDTADDALPRWGAFSYPNYRLYWAASLVRVFAIQFRIIGTLWLVAHELDRSPAWVGIVMLSAAIPTIVLVVPFGHLADRLDNRRLLIVSSAVSAALHFVLALLVVTGAIELWMVIVWSIATGAMNAMMAPAQNAILPQLIDMRVIASAVAYSSSIWNGMRVIGPAAAGVIIAVLGTGQAFFVTAAGYAIATMLTVVLHPAPRAAPVRKSEGNPLLEGARYVLGNRLFVAVIGLSFFTSLFGSSYQVLLPFFAEDILNVGEVGFGLLEAAAGGWCDPRDVGDREAGRVTASRANHAVRCYDLRAAGDCVRGQRSDGVVAGDAVRRWVRSQRLPQPGYDDAPARGP